MPGSKKTKYLIGERYQNKWGDWFTIVGYDDQSSSVRYIKFDSGYKCQTYISGIINENIKDYYKKTYYGVGCLGMKKGTNHPLFWRWFNMMGRCYDKTHCHYESYGAKGVEVSEELRNFSNYVEIVSKLDNYEELLSNPKEWQIDKDLLGDGKIYSKDTIVIIPAKHNLKIENEEKQISIDMFDLGENLLATFPSITAAEIVTGISRGNIARTVRGESHTAGGYYWRKH